MEIQLGLLKFEEELLIEGFRGDALICERLHELGLYCGLELIYLRQAPFQGPHLIRYNNNVLALREEEIQCLVLIKK